MSRRGLGPTVAIECNVNKYNFFAFLQDVFLPQVRRGSVLIADRLAAHHAQMIRELVEGAGCVLLALPPYSPELSPIEEAFSKIKGIMRRAAARTTVTLIEAFKSATGRVTSKDIEGWFDHADAELRARST